MEFQIITLEGKDTEEGRFAVHLFGRTQEGKSVHAWTYFNPYFFVKGQHGTKLVKKKDLWGFQDGKEHVFTMISCSSLAEFKQKPREFWGKGKLYETNIDPLLRFMHRTGIKATGWVNVPSFTKTEESRCDYDIFVDDWTLLKPVEKNTPAQFRIMSLDIECYSNTKKFPNSMNSEDACFQIAMTTKQGGKYIDRICLCLGPSDPHPSFKTEGQLLEAFVKHVQKIDPDVITGWNVFGFDFEYLANRMALCGVRAELGRIKYENSELITKNLSSSALGNNILKILKMSGRFVFDMYHEIKKEHKFDSYSLDFVSKTVLNDSKIDMPVYEIFKRFETQQGLAECADYCIKDTELPHEISEKLSTFRNLTEMATVCWVPISFLTERGQQIKVFSQISLVARELGFMIPTIKQLEAGKYQGATVLDAQIGAYMNPITALDFASLYPSIMCAENLCYSTFVCDEKYSNIPGVEYQKFGNFTFALSKNGKKIPSLLPIILDRLKVYRKESKKQMILDPDNYNIHNARQLAYKISMNSVYGFTGAAHGILPLIAIAETVTFRGRQMIEQSKKYVEEHFEGAHVRYGDSVMPETPVLVRRNGIVSIEKIENLGDLWVEYPGFLKDGTNKEHSEIQEIESWTHNGWQPIRRVIRHKCQKKIWRVLTHTGLVDVTEDHSLLDTNLNQVKPENLIIGQNLYHSFPDSTIIECDYTDEQLFVFGMFVGDGSCGLYDCPSGKKATWAINNQSLELLEKCGIILESMYPDMKFVIMDTLESSGVYKLSPRGKVRQLTEKWRSLCYDGFSKKVPDFAIGRKGFLDGLWASDGCRRDNEVGGCLRIDTKNQVIAQWYYLYLCSLGYRVSLNTRTDKPNIFRLTFSKASFRKDSKVIKKVHVLHDSWDGYVYDLETEAGTFQAGIGQMIVKNTDSIMVEFHTPGKTGLEAIKESWRLGELASKQISGLFKSPNNLELEKVYWPYVLYSKKRYAAKMWEVDKNGEPIFVKIDVKGLQTVRRDFCPYAREVCENILASILNTETSSDEAVAIAKKARDRLLSGQVPIQELTLTKKLSGDYKTMVPHQEVVKKMKLRNPGSEPQVGSRVPFVIICGSSQKMCENAEDPVYVMNNPKIKLDYKYYFEHQLRKSCIDLLEPLVGSDVDIFEKQKTRRITDFFANI